MAVEVTVKWSSGKVKKGKGHGGESMEFKSAYCAVRGLGGTPTCHMVAIVGLSGRLKEDVCDVLSVAVHLITTGSGDTRELSLEALLVVRWVW